MNVEFAEMFLHHKNNRIEIINCKLAEGLEFSVAPTVNEESALTAAINHLGSENLYSWQDEDYEAAYKEEKEDSNATTFPSGKLVIAKLNADRNYAPSEFVLSWRFHIRSLDSAFDVTVYVDANTGDIIKQRGNIQEGQTDLSYGYGNNVYIDTRWRGGLYSHHVLRSDDANAPAIWTKKASYNTGRLKPFGGYDCFVGMWCTNNSFDDDDIWTDLEVTTPHWLATRSWNYFQNTFGRNGYDNNGTEVKILGGVNIDNAYWHTEYHYLGFGRNNGNHWATRDVVGHEYTHALTQSTAGLVYERESGALNESFSDIFGYEIERFINGGVHTNWNIGEDVNLIRRMNSPSTSPSVTQPSVFNGPNWFNVNGCAPDANNDFCGVHTNSGVQNYWFYLLSEGSAGAPDGTLAGITVNGIGADAARNITFYNLDNFMGNNSVYQDARSGAISAATIIYGICSNEVSQTMNAWAAVGLGVPKIPLTVSGPSYIFYYGNNNTIVGGMPKEYIVSGGNALSYSWSYSGPWTTTIATNGVKANNIFRINDFNANYATTTIQVQDVCTTAQKTIRFINMIEEQHEINVVVSPNPAGGVIVVNTDTDGEPLEGDVALLITDVNGSPKFEHIYGSMPAEINVSGLPTGNYFITVRNGERTGHTQFMKE